ncbi:MAG: ankyrin repeat domain-containing protein, partial [Chloroflexi bacterium]|nr:ankyrin repeat domain-containing protein [Chloroflexota bacterium]
MRVLLYNDLDPGAIRGLDKVRSALEAGNFAQADVRKIGKHLYRAKLNASDRLLFTLRRYAGEYCCLLLEHIPNHAYDRSRFLRGAVVDETKIPVAAAPQDGQCEEIVYLHPQRERFAFLDKVLSFDDDQQAVYELPPPLVAVGSAGSGKTVVALEKMKRAAGDVLYVSLSPYLVKNARDLYFANGYDNADQEVSFLSFQELIESIRVPEGREARPKDFHGWFARHCQGSGVKDGHALYEEFRGVITGPITDSGWRSREEYLGLGVKQSIFPQPLRPRVYDLFERYLVFLKSEGLYDSNLVAHRYLACAEPRYDFVVVDEVQDVTNVQLYLTLKCLRQAGAFVLAGDSNQIVHPNFFSWSNVKSLFFGKHELTERDEAVRILATNFRNAPEVTALANRILKLKHARFGSVDRESNYLVRPANTRPGRVQLLKGADEVKRDLDARTSRSTRFAVIVMHEAQKAEARRWFNTPLVFSIQEAKGLEYESVILFDFVGGEAAAFREIAAGVDAAALNGDELPYARARDKSDRSLEIYKFFINALYVAVTRAVKNVFVVESDPGHPVIGLLQLDRDTGEVTVERSESSHEDWQREARNLELQGKAEQADEVRARILKEQAPPWQVIDRETFARIRREALAQGGSKQRRLDAFEYALLHHHRPTLNALRAIGFKPAMRDELEAVAQSHRNQFPFYDSSSPRAALRDVDRYGVNHRTRFNLTSLMIAARLGNTNLVDALLERGADLSCTANNGFTAFHFALEQALIDPAFGAERLPRIYPLLEPATVSVQVDQRLIKLDQRQMESFLLHLFIVLYYRHLAAGFSFSENGYTAAALEAYVARVPDAVLPAWRKRRPYITSVLARNEAGRDGPYNRRLFRRLHRGYYILNPQLKFRDGERWIPAYERFPLEDLGIRPW